MAMITHRPRWLLERLGLGLALALLSGCGPAEGTGTGSGSGGDPAADIAQWNKDVATYDARRSMFLGTHVQDLAAFGDQLFWYDNTNFDFRLARYDDATGTKVNYTFPIGSGDLHNYRASDKFVVTADPKGDPVVYHAYDVSSPQMEIGSTTMKKPS